MTAEFTDIDIEKNVLGYYDFTITDAGDFQTTDGFDTAIKMTLMCERRASASQVPAPQFRRGWIGNLQLGYALFEIGSLLWLLSQARAIQNTLNDAITFTNTAFQWMIDDGYLERVETNSEYLNTTGMLLAINFIRAQDSVFTRYFDVWNNTFSIEN